MNRTSKEGAWFAQLEEAGIKKKKVGEEGSDPTLAPHLNWIWKAFTELSYRRSVGMNGPLPINFSDISAYCSLRQIYLPSERQRLLRMLEVLDQQWMQTTYENIEKENKKAEKKGTSTVPTANTPRSPPNRKPLRKEIS